MIVCSQENTEEMRKKKMNAEGDLRFLKNCLKENELKIEEKKMKERQAMEAAKREEEKSKEISNELNNMHDALVNERSTRKEKKHKKHHQEENNENPKTNTENPADEKNKNIGEQPLLDPENSGVGDFGSKIEPAPDSGDDEASKKKKCC